MRALIIALALSAAAAPAALAQTVVLVRHAEKANDGSSNPPLAAEGAARAAELARTLADADLTHVFVTPLRRTQDTARPAAEAHALTPEAVPLDGGVEAHVRAVADKVRALPTDAVALVVGHSNTVPLIARALGQTGPGEMKDCEYDRLTVISLEGDGDSPAVVSRYGEPSPRC